MTLPETAGYCLLLRLGHGQTTTSAKMDCDCVGRYGLNLVDNLQMVQHLVYRESWACLARGRLHARCGVELDHSDGLLHRQMQASARGE
jgi:hypothetical protein